jgi:hypothetical protein
MLGALCVIHFILSCLRMVFIKEYQLKSRYIFSILLSLNLSGVQIMLQTRCSQTTYLKQRHKTVLESLLQIMFKLDISDFLTV